MASDRTNYKKKINDFLQRVTDKFNKPHKLNSAPEKQNKLIATNVVSEELNDLTPVKLNYTKKINEFLQRLTDRFDGPNKLNMLPDELSDLITLKELRIIYWSLIHCGKPYLAPYLKKGEPHRIPKEISGLSRTLNLIIDPETNDICLILETKRKTVTGKDYSMKALSGACKSTKPAWRIDTISPEKYANSVYYVNKDEDIENAKNEVSISQKVQLPGSDRVVNLMIAGKAFQKTGLRQVGGLKRGGVSEPYKTKISLYSKWANQGDLAKWIRTKPILDSETMGKMATQLLLSVQNMHSKGIIHQDIKFENILVFKDEAGAYRLALTDFGNSVSSTFSESRPLASIGYESPEISALYYYTHKQQSSYYNYFHSEWSPSYGREIFKLYKEYYKNEIKKQGEVFFCPDKANDMWAIGIVLYQLYEAYKDTGPQLKGELSIAKVISGLLNPDREKRLTIEKALEINKLYQTKKPILLGYGQRGIVKRLGTHMLSGEKSFFGKMEDLETYLESLEALEIDTKIKP